MNYADTANVCEPENASDHYNSAYVDLLKRILCNSIYPQGIATTASDIETCESAIRAVRAKTPWVLETYKNLDARKLAELLAYTKRSRNVHTYVRKRGLDNLEDCARAVVEAGIPGDFIDAGTLRGGTAILMRGVLKALGARDRRVIVADSFMGLPPPGEWDSLFDREIWFGLLDHLPQYNLKCDENVEEVKRNFASYGLLDEVVEFAVGWFRDSLPALVHRRFALVRIDADWYEGTRDALDALYPRISPGGYVIVDDYKLQGCKRAVDEYRTKHRVFTKIRVADHEDGVVFWQKGDEL